MVFKYITLVYLLVAPFYKDKSEAIFAANLIKKDHSATANFSIETANSLRSAYSVYNNLHPNHFSLPQITSFSQAFAGFYKLKELGLIKKDVLTLIDFSLSSKTPRLWVIDMASKTILFQSLVAHGKNTGNDFATRFSNAADSFQSSLGFYLTGEVYNGKHGLSLRLDGLEVGINDNARERGVVVHAADYVSNSFVKNHNRLGRSQGCPALPNGLSKEIIQVIKDQSCLFIYHPQLQSNFVPKAIYTSENEAPLL